MLSLRSIIFCCLLSAVLIISCKQPDTLFTSVSPGKSNVHFENKLTPQKAFGILYYLYYYNGGGVSTGDINNDGLPDIYFTANSKGGNKLYLNKGNFKFEDVAEKSNVAGTSDWCTGSAMADINGDGLLDIYVSAVNINGKLKGRNELFINNGDTTFTESAEKYGLNFSGFSTQAAFFDYDHDGDLDCYILNQSHKANENIVDTINRRKFDAQAGDKLMRNDMNLPGGRFTDVSTAAGILQSSLGYGLGISIADLNNDGWDDIYVGNDFHENDYYYVNNGNGTFAESGARHFNHYSRFSMGNDVADYNNDGQLDVVTVDMLPTDEKVLKTYGSDENPDVYKFKLIKNGFQHQYSKNCLQRNNGNGTSFSETGLLSGVAATDWSWSPLFADFDNDGNKDLFISSGIVKRQLDLDYIRFISSASMRQALNTTDKLDNVALEQMPDGASHPYLFKGDGMADFSDVSESWGTGKMKGYYNGGAYADLDNDGNLDLVINCINAPAVLLKNNAPKKNHLSISFKGEGLNTSGIGAKAYLFKNNKIQYQQLMLTRGFQSSSEPRLHFGINDQTFVDSVLIVWPNQQYQLIKNVQPGTLSVKQTDATSVFDYANFFTPQTHLMEDITSRVNINWKHWENDFNDFDIQYLLPHAQSTRGPKVAVADVNGDGLDDFYACGAKGQPRSLMIQQKNGSFATMDTATFNKDLACEDVDAVFFDANGDGALDLFTVSGGNEYTGNAEPLKDRLYLNDGNGRFTKAANALPPIFENKSTVSIADIDHDGDNDIFVGTLADAVAYGVPVSSHLLLNDGKGNFSLADTSIITLDKIGMVTTSAFADINKDGWTDLVIAGEFMPLTVFINRKGKFEKTVIPNSTGLWQTVLLEDVNNDGFTDILAGNWGWNNKFWSGKNGPVKMYVSDYDLNGKKDQLLAYTLNGTEYPFLAKDEVERTLPLLKKHYLLYADYAGVPMKDVFYGWIDTITPVIAERLGSVVCFGNGKGNFEINDLPVELQLAPVFTFQQIPGALTEGKTYMAGGNFFDVIPYEGRYDAQPLALFTVNKNKVVQYIAQSNLASEKGQFRDLKWINTASNGKVLMAAANNQPLRFYGYNR